MSEAPLIVRGGRAIQPREVEQVLLGHPAVAEVAVVGLPDRFWGEIVGAAVRLSAPLPSAARELTRYCRGFIADYKAPERWLLTAALPRTPGGAVCRAAVATLLAVPGARGASRRGPVDPGGLFRPRLAIEELRVPRQTRRSWAPDDL